MRAEPPQAWEVLYSAEWKIQCVPRSTVLEGVSLDVVVIVRSWEVDWKMVGSERRVLIEICKVCVRTLLRMPSTESEFHFRHA